MRTPSSCLRAALLVATCAAVAVAQAQPTGTDTRVAKLYNLGELATHVGAYAELRPTPAGGQPFEPEAAAPTATNPQTNPQTNPTTSPATIARLLRAFVQPPLLANEEVTSVGDRWIVAICRVEQHAWIDRFLKAARDNANNQAQQQVLSIECSWYSIPELAFLRDVKPVLVRLNPREREVSRDNGQTNERAQTSYLSEVLAPGKDTEAFLSEMELNTDVTNIQSPTMTVLPLHVGHMAVINPTAYVRDFDLEVAKAAFIANPIVDVIQDGIVLNTAIAPLENGMLGVSLDAHIANLKRPIETHEVDLGFAEVVKIQLPHLQSTQIEAAVELAPEHVVVLAPPPLSGKRILFVVRVKPGQQQNAADPAKDPVIKAPLMRLPPKNKRPGKN